MVRTVGSKNKRVVKKIAPKKIFRKIELDFDDEEEERVDVSMRSSVPLGDLKERTEGWQPRSRSAESREAGFRSKEEKIDFFRRSINSVQKGRTHLPETLNNDPEYVYMWAREQVRDRYDGHNLRNLEFVKGWEYVDPSDAPELGFYSSTGDVQDSAGRIRDGGLILMKRYKEIHNDELAQQRVLRHQQSRIENIVRTINTEMHPFATGSINHNDSFFPSDGLANSFSGAFGSR